MTTTTQGSRYGVLPWVVVVAAIALSSASAPRVQVTAASGSTGTASTGSTITGSTGGSSTCGNCSGNNGSGSGNGGATGTGSPGKTIKVTGVVAGELAPGRAGTLDVTITNPNNQSITVRTVTGSVTSVGTRGFANKPACTTSWFTVGRFDGALVIAKNSGNTVKLPIAFADLRDTNQDNCKNVTFNFTFSATADGV